MYELEPEKAFSDNLVLKVKELKKEISKVIIGQDEVVNGLIISILSNGHALLIGVPGLAKTLLIKTISEALDLSFNRVQFTPALFLCAILPAFGQKSKNEKVDYKYIQLPMEPLPTEIKNYAVSIVVGYAEKEAEKAKQ